MAGPPSTPDIFGDRRYGRVGPISDICSAAKRLTRSRRRRRRAVRASNTRTIHRAACKAGLGLAILPCLMADPDPDLIRLLPPEKVVSVELWLVVHRDLVRTARIRAVIDFLVEVCPKTTSMRHRSQAR
jgi:DNA-binding transcriptional LysR family regulator